jgi:hypothetical protein
MMKKVMLISALIVGLSSVNQAQAVSKKVIYGTVALVVGAIAGGLIYKYCVQEHAKAKEQEAVSADEEAILKHR